MKRGTKEGICRLTASVDRVAKYKPAAKSVLEDNIVSGRFIAEGAEDKRPLHLNRHRPTDCVQDKENPTTPKQQNIARHYTQTQAHKGTNTHRQTNIHAQKDMLTH